MRFTFTVFLSAALSLGPALSAQPLESPDPPLLILEGVVVSPDPLLSVALLRSPNSRWSRAVRVGETYLGLRLVEVREGSVVLEKEGKRFDLALKGEPPAPSPTLAAARGERVPGDGPASGSSARFVERDLDRAQAEARLQRELPVILAETRVTPRVNGGEVQGYRITHLPAGTLLSEMGLAAGDVLLSIDDLPIEKLGGLLRKPPSYPEFLSKSRIRVLVEREGETLELVYHLR